MNMFPHHNKTKTSDYILSPDDWIILVLFKPLIHVYRIPKSLFVEV